MKCWPQKEEKIYAQNQIWNLDRIKRFKLNFVAILVELELMRVGLLLLIRVKKMKNKSVNSKN